MIVTLLSHSFNLDSKTLLSSRKTYQFSARKYIWSYYILVSLTVKSCKRFTKTSNNGNTFKYHLLQSIYCRRLFESVNTKCTSKLPRIIVTHLSHFSLKICSKVIFKGNHNRVLRCIEGMSLNGPKALDQVNRSGQCPI